MRTTWILGGLVAWAIAACGTHPPTDGDDGGLTTAGSGATSGGAGGGGDGGSTSGGTGAAAGTSSTGGSGGSGGDGGTGTGKGGSGGDAGRGGTSSTGGASGGAGTGAQDAGPPGTQPGCGIVGSLNAQGFIAFDSDRDSFHRNLYMMHPDRTGLTQLTTGLHNDREPFFSPDGKQLLYTSDVDGQPQIFLMDVATRSSFQLTKRPDGADESSFSRDGQWAAFHSGASVYIIKIDGTGEKLVATGLAPGGNAYHWPVFSAAGTELVFDRYNEIDATNLDGMGFRYIVGNTTAQIKSPAISPDGADVAYQAGCYTDGGILSIWTTPFATTTQLCMGRRVTPADAYDAKNPAWVTIVAIAYERVNRTTNLGSLALIGRAVGSTPCLLTPPTEDSRNPTWSGP